MEDFLTIARSVLRCEAEAILTTAEYLSEDFVKVVNMIQNHKGKIVLCGIGKSGFIAQKIAATLTSTGVHAVYLHPTDALHGDLGIYTPGDPTLLISRSGSTSELLTLVPILRHFQSPLVAIVGNTKSPLAKRCDYVLEAYVDREADPLDLIPTTSAVTALAIGDALASVLMSSRKFQKEDFAKFHPGGQLGRNLLLSVGDVMQPLDNVPQARLETSIRDVVISLTEHPVGGCCVVDDAGKLLGIITDGDIRRLIQKTDNLHGICAQEIYHPAPRTISKNAILGDAIGVMESGDSQVYVLPVVADNNRLVGLLRLHDAYQNPSH